MINLLLQFFREPRFAEKRWFIKESIIPVILIGLSIFLFHGIIGKEIPSTFDHTTQILRCWLTELSLWKYGTLLPWTSAVGAGVPLNDLYPPGGAMLFCCIRLFSWFLLSVKNAYVILVFLAWFVLIGSVYFTGRRLFGIPGGTIAALMLMLDPGTSGLVGWIQCFTIALWPMSLSVGFTVIAVFLFAQALENPQWIYLKLLLAIFSAAAILAHVLALIGLGIHIILVSIIYSLFTSNRKSYFSALAANWFFLVLGCGLAGWWLIPFLGSSEWTRPFGGALMTAAQFMDRFVQGNLFETTPPLFLFIGFIGMLWGLGTGRPFPTALSLAYLVNFIVNLDIWYSIFFTESFARIFMNIPLMRLWSFSKVWGYILAGGMLQSFFIPDDTNFRHRLYPLPRRQRVAIGIGILAFTIWIIFPFLQYSYRQFLKMRELFPIQTADQYSYYQNELKQIMNDIHKMEPALNEDTFFLPFCPVRIGIQDNIIESSIPFQHGYGIVSSRYMPTMVLTTQTAVDESLSDRLSGMKYRIGEGENNEFLKKISNLRILSTFNDITLYQCTKFTGTPYAFCEAEKGAAFLESQKYGQISIRLTNISDKQWLHIGVSRYRKWQAYLNDKPLPIVEHIHADESTDAGRYISVLVENGLLELRYENQWIDWAGIFCAIFSGIGLVVLTVIKRWYQWLFFAEHSPVMLFYRTIKDNFIVILKYFLVIPLVIMVLVFYIIQHPIASCFWYAGITTNVVGIKGWTSDEQLDLEFGLFLGYDCQGKTLQSVFMREVLPGAPTLSRHCWTTGADKAMKLAWFVYGDNGGRWDRAGQDLNRWLSPPNKVRIYAANPYRGGYIPERTQIQIDLHFTDGTSKTYTCRLLPQGYH